jgi:diguanylate cyclase (GGDEF)-like protein
MRKQFISDFSSQRKLQFLADMTEQDPNPIIGLDSQNNIAYCNVSGKEILLYWQKLYNELPKTLLIAAQNCRTSHQIIREEMDINNKNYLFTLVWVAEFNHVNLYGTDITQLKTKEQDILNLANIDSLTKIANRQYFQQRLETLLDESSITNSPISLLLIDLDNFKLVNDSLGHAMGDKLLQSATKRMVRCLRAQDFIARLGGDEFIIILDKTDLVGASIVADKINQVLIKPFQFGGYRMEIGCSIGIAIYPETGKSVTELLKHADIAMYQAKKAGKNKSQTFSNQLYHKQYQRE